MNSVTRFLGLAPTKKVYETPYKMWRMVYSSLSHTEVYDYEVYARHEAINNLELKIETCYLIG